MEAGAVRELRDRVEISKAMDLLDRAGALGGVLDRSHQTEDAAGGAQQCFAEHVHMTQLPVLSDDAHVEPLLHLRPCKLDQPATEGPAIFLVNELPDRGWARTELRRVYAEDPERLARAHDTVACPLPLPAPDAGNALRAGQLLRQAAVGDVLIFGDFVRGHEPSLAARDATMHVIEPALQPFEADRPRLGKKRRFVTARAETGQRRSQLRDRARYATADD